MNKRLPVGVLTINARFAETVAAFHAGFDGKKPEDPVAAERIAAVVFASLHENLSAFEFLRKPFSVGAYPPNEPRSAVEVWLHYFLRYPDFTLALMKKARTFVQKYDALDRVLYRLSAAGTLANMSDGDVILEVRKLGIRVSQDAVEARRSRWTQADKKR